MNLAFEKKEQVLREIFMADLEAKIQRSKELFKKELADVKSQVKGY